MPTRKVNAYPNDSRVLDVRFYYDLEQMHSMGTPFFKSLHVNVPLYTGARVKNEFFLSFDSANHYSVKTEFLPRARVKNELFPRSVSTNNYSVGTELLPENENIKKMNFPLVRFSRTTTPRKPKFYPRTRVKNEFFLSFGFHTPLLRKPNFYPRTRVKNDFFSRSVYTSHYTVETELLSENASKK